MRTELTPENLARVRNPQLKSYAARYNASYENFMGQIRGFGLEVDASASAEATRTRIEALRQAGAIVRNADKSVYANRISPSCEACRTGENSSTFFISLKCHRDCFFCFNPNQEEYEYHRTHKRDLVQELNRAAAEGASFEHLALTGGEPLLYKDDTVAFFRTAHERFPAAATRIYTSGDHIDDTTLVALRDARLDEIRFSIRLHDTERGRQHTLDRIALAKQYIPRVMVEMPVLPGAQDEMKGVLRALDALDIFSINLLEFCFPLSNAEIYRQRGYKIKARPFRVLYDYWYAGGLPVAGSETTCLDLVQFALDEKLRIGVHYCSLENKHTGQVFAQNTAHPLPPNGYLSPNDFFIKTAKVFGNDVPPVRRALKNLGDTTFSQRREYNYLEFHVERIPALRDLEIEIGLSTNIMEADRQGPYLKELQMDLTTPREFDPAFDL